MNAHVAPRCRPRAEADRKAKAVVPNIPKKKSHPLCTAHGAYPLFAAAYVLRPVSKWKELERCYGQIAQFATGRNDVKLTTIILKSTAEDELFTKNLVVLRTLLYAPPTVRRKSAYDEAAEEQGGG